MSNFLMFHIKRDSIYNNLLFHCQVPKYSHVTCRFTVTVNKYGTAGSFCSSVRTVRLQHAGRGGGISLAADLGWFRASILGWPCPQTGAPAGSATGTNGEFME